MITIEQVKEFIETDEEGQKLLQSLTDSTVTKAIDTWKENNLDKVVDKKIAELNPSEDPKDKKIKELHKELEEFKQQTLMSEIKSEALQVASEKKLPADIVKLLITSDKDKTNSNIEAFESVWTETLKGHRKESVSSSTPEVSQFDNKSISLDQFKDMSYQDKKELKQVNPDLYGELTQ